jgi:hypothetical protein
VRCLRAGQTIGRLTVVVAVLIAAGWAQESLPKPALQLVRVRIGNSCGWCTEGYNDTETTVEPQRIVNVNRAYSKKKKYPDRIYEYTITEKEWHDLQLLIEARVLDVLAKPTTGCPGCADEPTTWTELQFGDGSKKSAAYNAGAEPAPIVELKQQIGKIQMEAWMRRSQSAPQR